MTNYIQGRIIGTLVRSILAAGFSVDVNDNDGDRETHAARSISFAEIMKAIFNPEIDACDYCLDLWKDGKPDANGCSFGMVRLIDGNGISVISDYSTVLEDVVASANVLANDIEFDEDKWIRGELLSRDNMRDALIALSKAADSHVELADFVSAARAAMERA